MIRVLKNVVFGIFLVLLWAFLFVSLATIGGAVAVYAFYPEVVFPTYRADLAQMRQHVKAGQKKILEGLSAQERTAANALSALEDHRILTRFLPIDIRGIGRAIVKNVTSRGRRLEGASTAQMQLAKLSFSRDDIRFSKDFYGKLRSKALQIRLAFDLFNVPPQTVLASYLVAFDCGLHRVRGFDVCSAYYFGKEPGDLSAKEAIVVASTVRAPNRYLNDLDLLGRRAEWAVVRMIEHGWLNKEEAAALSAEPSPRVKRDVDFAAAVARRGDTGLARAAIAARTAALRALAAAIEKKGIEADPRDFRVFAGLWEDTGTSGTKLVAFAGGPESIARNRIDGGSFVKPFLGRMLLKKAGAKYLSMSIPYRVAAYDRLGRPFTPSDVHPETLPERAPVMTYLVKSSNAGNVSALSYAMVYLRPADLRRAAKEMGITTKSAGAKANAVGPVIEIASSFAGTDVAPLLGDDKFVGYGKAMTLLLRWFGSEMLTNVPRLEIKNLDVAAVLGAGVSAPFDAWVRGFSRIWFDPDGPCLSQLGTMMAEYSPQGTLKSVAAAHGGLPMKTQTAERTAGSAVAFLARNKDGQVGKYVLATLLYRVDGATLPDEIYGATIGSPATNGFFQAAKRAGLDLVHAARADASCKTPVARAKNGR